MNRVLLAIAVLLAIPLLLWVDPSTIRWRLFPFAWDLGHVALFALLTGLSLSAFPWLARLPLRYRLPLVTVSVVLLGCVIEGAQYFLGREASVNDILRNLLGALLVLSFYPRRKLGLRISLLRTVALLALLVAISPLVINALDSVVARRVFPVLADFETPFELSRWKGEQLVIRKWGEPDNHVLAAYFSPGEFSAINLYADPSDWRGYRQLSFRIYNWSDAELTLHFRVNDQWHYRSSWDGEDRYNSELRLAPGWNSFSVDLETVRRRPKTRSMDMSLIDHLAFFTYRLQSARQLYFDDIRLVK